MENSEPTVNEEIAREQVNHSNKEPH